MRKMPNRLWWLEARDWAIRPERTTKRKVAEVREIRITPPRWELPGGRGIQGKSNMGVRGKKERKNRYFGCEETFIGDKIRHEKERQEFGACQGVRKIGNEICCALHRRREGEHGGTLPTKRKRKRSKKGKTGMASIGEKRKIVHPRQRAFPVKGRGGLDPNREKSCTVEEVGGGVNTKLVLGKSEFMSRQRSEE